MRLDDLRWAAHRARFDYVGIKRALHQPLDFAFFLLDAMGLLVEYGDEFDADDFAFFLGIGYARQLAQEAIRGVDCDYVQAELVTQVLLDFFELVLSEYAVVHEHRSQAGRAFAISKGAIDQGGGYGGIHAAGERADRPASANCLPHAGNGCVDEVLRSPCGFGAADHEREVAQDVGPG